MEINALWKTLEETASAMENGEGDWQILAAAAQESIRLLFEFAPGEIMQEAQQSHYPTKAVIKWLLYEGQKIRGIGRDRLVGLCSYWNQGMGKEQGNINFPVMA